MLDDSGLVYNVLAEYDDTLHATTLYTYGTDIISIETNSETSYYIVDGQGSTRALTDANGNITDTYTYDAYGNITEQTGNTYNPYLYNQEQYDANTGLYYLRARYMNPSTGRFVSMDSYGGSIYDPTSLHKYLYANASPTIYCDPTGYNGEFFETLTALTIDGILLRSLIGGWAYSFGNYVATLNHTPENERNYNEIVKNCFKDFADGFSFCFLTQLALKDVADALLQRNYSLTNVAPEEKSNESYCGTQVDNASQACNKANEEIIHVYRGTGIYTELSVYEDTGHLMSDATRNIYLETGDLETAYAQSKGIHTEWLKIWGNENDFVQAHSAFGSEISSAFELDRTFMSVTTDFNTAKYFAGPCGRVFEADIPKSQLIQQTLSDAESEFLVSLGSGGFK